MDPRRMITTRIWADAWFEELDSESKLLWLYLLTNQQTNLIGIYEISIRRISNETGINSNRLETLLDGFANRSKIIWTGSYMVICNFLKHQNLANPNMEKSAAKIFDTLPDTIRKVLLLHGIKDFKYFLNGFPNPSKTHTDGFGEREREREIEREIERERERESKGKTENPIGFSKVLNDDVFHQHQNLKAEDYPKSQTSENQKAATTQIVENSKTETVLWPTFDDFWNAYDKKRGDRDKIQKKWDKLSQQDKEAAMSYIPEYIIAQPDKQFRKDPATFLNNKSWNDEIITRNNPQSIQQPSSTAGSVSRIYQKLVASRGAG